MPVRKITNRGGRKLIGKYPSEKMGRVVHWEGPLERDYVSILEWDTTVIEYWEQPIKIKYLLDGKKRCYTPDFLVIKEDLKELIEVKPSNRINNPNTIRQKKVALDYCSKKGLHFDLVTDKIREGYFLKNIKLLERYSREKVSLFFKEDAINIVLKSGPITIDDLSQQMEEQKNNNSIQQTFYLLYKSILKVNMNDIITKRSVILGVNDIA